MAAGSGPTDYVALEMRDDADKADPGPAGGSAVAKTLWVLLMGESRPFRARTGPLIPRTRRQAGPESQRPGLPRAS
jgi:hypothetical protein